jgi:lipopolysaccharide/colanic/teichoic acid biosynthesis glycosyltransferase
MVDGMTEKSRTFIEDTEADGTSIWQQVDLALQRGDQVWLRSPLLEVLADALGQECNGHRWLVIEPGSRRHHVLVRIRDACLSALALACLSPVLLIIAILIKFGSKGPVFFATTVVGKKRTHFTWHKLRSMREIPESVDVERRRARFQEYVEGKRPIGSQQAPTKVVDRSRVTPIGAFIRKYSIDELPQLWNVLCGEMSLVGPRPCLTYEAEFFTGWRGRRFDVKPGLSGVWQVYGRGRVGFDEAAAMDVFYIYRRSLRFDLYLVFKTFGVVFTGRGAL